MKLGTKASLLILTIGAVLFVPLSTIMIHFQERALRQASFNTVDSAATNSMMLVSQFRETALRNINSLAVSIPPESFQTKSLGFLATQIQRVYETQNFDNGIVIFDTKGKIILDYPAHPETRGKPFGFRDYFQGAMAERHGVMGEPYVSVRTGRPVITFAAPVKDKKDSIVGVVACSYDLLAPGALGGIQGERLGRTGYVYLFDHTRLMIIHPDPKRMLQRDIPLGANKVLDKAISGYEGIGETVNSRGLPMLLSFRRVPGTSWILGAQIPRAEAFEALSFSRHVMLVTTVLSILIIVGVSILVVRHFAKPLGQLSAAARAILKELGGGPFASGVIPVLDSIRAKDETGILANTFRELVARQRQSLGMLRKAASEWERTFDAVNEAVLCLDHQGRVLRINRMASLWFRVSPDNAVGQAARSLALGDDSGTEFWPEASLLDVEHALTWTGRIQQAEGIFEFRASPVVQDGAISGMILSVRDFTQQAQKEEDTRKRAFFDGLTGLPNRALLMDRLQQALAAGARSGLGVGVIFLDLDHFKAINDSLGHDAGDNLLKEVAHRFAALVRKNDTVSRLGGDEFVMVISETRGPEDAELVATKVIQSLGCPFSFDGHELNVGASIGIANAPADGADGATLLKCADAAMYQAKREGRSSFRFYSPTHPPLQGENPA